MSDEDEPTQLLRAHRAKRAGVASFGGVDGGAIAVGLLVASGLVLGGYVCGQLRAPGSRCSACHGALVGLSFVVVVAGVSVSTIVAGGHASDLAVIEAGNVGVRTTGIGILAAVAVGAFGGFASAVGSAA